MIESNGTLKNSIVFYEFNRVGNNEDQHRVAAQIIRAGFTGDLKVFNLGFDSKDTISFVIDGVYLGKKCCCAVGYEMSRKNLIIKARWTRHASDKFS